jgi:8-oxo-dGTP pyrophosphatase MutT (NUDIX family)
MRSRLDIEAKMNSKDRALLIDLLELCHPEDEREAADLAAMRTFARTLEQPFSRKEVEAHFTASAILVSTSGQEICLVYHRKLSRWLQPGGHFEPEDDGSVERAALREVLEETGCRAERVQGSPVPFDVDIHEIPERGREPAHLHLDLRILARALKKKSATAREIEWLSWADVRARADDASLRRALSKAQRLLAP